MWLSSPSIPQWEKYLSSKRIVIVKPGFRQYACNFWFDRVVSVVKGKVTLARGQK